VIRVVRGELATAAAEAVLRPVAAEWAAVTPAMRRLEVAAGAAVEAQCRALGELPVGSAVITGAGQLPAQFLVHVIVRSIDEPVSAATVRRALENGLRRIGEWGIRSVAMPPLGTGAGNLDAEDAAAVMFDVLRTRPAELQVEIFVDTEYEHTAFLQWVER
jgi:O-acetyl-ADP-ribose deacetylase